MSISTIQVAKAQDYPWNNLYCNTLNCNTINASGGATGATGASGDITVNDLSANNIYFVTASGASLYVTDLTYVTASGSNTFTQNLTFVSASGAIGSSLYSENITFLTASGASGSNLSSDNLTFINATGATLGAVEIDAVVVNANRQYGSVYANVTTALIDGAPVVLTWEHVGTNVGTQGMTYVNGPPGSGCAGFNVNQPGVYYVNTNFALDLSTTLSAGDTLTIAFLRNASRFPVISINADTCAPVAANISPYFSASTILDCGVNDQITLEMLYTKGGGGPTYSLTGSNNCTFMACLMSAHV